MEGKALAHSREQGSFLKRPPAGSLCRCRPSTPVSHRRSHRGNRNSTDYETIWMDVLEVVKPIALLQRNLFRFTGLFLSNRFRRNSLSHCCSENSRFKKGLLQEGGLKRSLFKAWGRDSVP